MWRLHHKIALIEPKLGEMIAFRNIIKEIPQNTAVDEASIESIMREKNYKLQYVPDAVVNNKGPENIRDFLKQRRRIAAGHLYLIHKQKYKVSTHSPARIISVLLEEHKWGIKNTIRTFFAISLEIIGRLLGNYDFLYKKKITLYMGYCGFNQNME